MEGCWGTGFGSPEWRWEACVWAAVSLPVCVAAPGSTWVAEQ